MPITEPKIVARQKYYPVPTDDDQYTKCERCAFCTPVNDPASPECMQIPCTGVIWLSVPNYILHKLTS